MALAHVGLSTTLYIAARSAVRFPPADPIDALMCVASALAIAALWWRRRNDEPDLSTGGTLGFQAGIALAIAVFLVVFLVVGAISARRGALDWEIGPITIYLAAVLLTAGLCTAVGGLIVSVIFELMVRPLGRAGAFAATVVALAAAATPIGEATTEIAADTSVFDFLARYDERHFFPMEVGIDLNIGGAVSRLDRVIACQRILRRSDLKRAHSWMQFTRNEDWLPDLKSFGQVFPDGSGVFAITPDACKALAQSGVAASLTGYVPLIGWTPNARALDSFDVYVDGAALARGDGRVQLKNVTIAQAPTGTPQSDLDIFARIGWQDPSTSGPRYQSVFGIAIAREEWQGDPALASRLEKLDRISFALADMPLKYAPSSNRPVAQWLGPNIIVGLARNGEGMADGLLWNGRRLRPTIIPLRRENGQWIARPDEPGLITFYPALVFGHDDGRKPEFPKTLVVDGELIPGEPSAFVYMPSTGTLVRLAWIDFSLAPMDGPFASRDPS